MTKKIFLGAFLFVTFLMSAQAGNALPKPTCDINDDACIRSFLGR